MSKNPIHSLSQDFPYKAIFAIKCLNDQYLQKLELICNDRRFSVGDKSCQTNLPFSEGLFLDMNDFHNIEHILISFLNEKQKVLASFNIKIPRQIKDREEIELSEEFNVQLAIDNGKNYNLKGSYYIILLNKIFLNDLNSVPNGSSSTLLGTPQFISPTNEEGSFFLIKKQKSAQIDKKAKNLSVHKQNDKEEQLSSSKKQPLHQKSFQKGVSQSSQKSKKSHLTLQDLNTSIQPKSINNSFTQRNSLSPCQTSSSRKTIQVKENIKKRAENCKQNKKNDSVHCSSSQSKDRLNTTDCIGEKNQQILSTQVSILGFNEQKCNNNEILSKYEFTVKELIQQIQNEQLQNSQLRKQNSEIKLSLVENNQQMTEWSLKSDDQKTLQEQVEQLRQSAIEKDKCIAQLYLKLEAYVQEMQQMQKDQQERVISCLLNIKKASQQKTKDNNLQQKIKVLRQENDEVLQSLDEKTYEIEQYLGKLKQEHLVQESWNLKMNQTSLFQSEKDNLKTEIGHMQARLETYQNQIVYLSQQICEKDKIIEVIYSITYLIKEKSQSIIDDQVGHKEKEYIVELQLLKLQAQIIVEKQVQQQQCQQEYQNMIDSKVFFSKTNENDYSLHGKGNLSISQILNKSSGW